MTTLLFFVLSLWFAAAASLKPTISPTMTRTLEATEMSALHAFYEALRGNQWYWHPDERTYGLHWNFTTIRNSSTYIHDPCGELWQGVYCSCNYTNKAKPKYESYAYNYDAYYDFTSQTRDTSYCSVIKIALSASNLAGTLPAAALGALKNLTHLHLGRNNIVGNISASICSLNAPTLRKLIVYQNKLTGKLPDSCIARMTSLKYLNLASNMLTATIPSSLGLLSNCTTLDLSSNNLIGTIPSSLGLLASHLLDLRLYNNQLTGEIPITLTYNVGLTYLDLSENSLQGTIPSSIGVLSNCKYLFLYGNALTSTIPSSLGLLSNCETLWLSRNALTGSIHSSFGQLSSRLLDLRIGFNFLTGEIPNSFSALVGLTYIDISGNSLLGAIPNWIGLLSNLTYLDFSANSLQSAIPSSIGFLSKCQYLLMHANSLTGDIPPLTNLARLITLDLSENSLQGTIPSSIGVLSNCIKIDLSSNALTGSLPSSLGLLSSCITINLSLNSLNGTIPSSLGFLSSSRLFELILRSNQLSGVIPHSLSRLIGLTYLDISENFLQGTIPSSLGLLSNCAVLYLDDNSLIGTIPSSLGLLSSHLLELRLGSNSLSGEIPNSLSRLVGLTYLDISVNSLQGVVPSALGNLTNLIFLRLFSNSLAGTLPSLLGHLSSLNFFLLSDNMLTGSIPSSFGLLIKCITLDLQVNYLTAEIPDSIGALSNTLQELHLSNNSLRGSVPSSFSNLSSLQVLGLSNNKLTSISFDLPSNLVRLEVMDVSSNALGGPLSPSFFLLPQLRNFAASANCLQGSLPNTICQAKQLQTLSLDGLSSGSTCKSYLWSNLFRLGAFHLTAEQSKHYLRGSVPACLFELGNNLQTLHLSANGWTGTLPAKGYSTRLRDFSISHNFLAGTVPAVLLSMGLQSLDISHNKLKGSLDSNAFVNNNTTLFSLSVNRLSGSVPVSLRDAENVDILRGNLFTCADKYKELPQNDGNFFAYSCGSTSFNEYYYAWLSVYCVPLLVLSLAAYSRLTRTLNADGEFVYLRENMTQNRFFDSLFILSSKVLTWQHACSSSSISSDFPNLFRVYLQLDQIRLFVLRVCLSTLALLLIIYPSMTAFYGALEEDYAWQFTAAFLSGIAPALMFLIIWTVALPVCFFVLKRQPVGAEAHDVLAYRKSLSSLGVMPLWRKTLLRFRLLVLICTDMSVALAANITFVSFSANGRSTASQTEAKLVYVLFKLTWNSFALPWMLSSKAFRFGQSKQHARTVLNQVASSPEEFRTLLLVFNSIIAPCIATALTDSRCFAYALTALPVIQSSYSYDFCQLYGDNGMCTKNITSPPIFVTIAPPFAYKSECSSALITNYSPVFVLLSLSGLANILFVCFARSFIQKPIQEDVGNFAGSQDSKDIIPLASASDTSSSSSSSTNSSSFSWCDCCRWTSEKRNTVVYLFFSRFLVPPLLRTKHEHELLESSVEVSEEDEEEDGNSKSTWSDKVQRCAFVFLTLGIVSVQKAKLREQMRTMFIPLVVNICLLMTFGFANPLLGLCLVASITASTLWLQTMMGRFVCEALHKSGGGRPLVEKLDHICAHVVFAPLRDVASYALFVSTLYFACFLYDMAADTQGLVVGVWAPLTLIFTMLVVFAKSQCKSSNKTPHEEASLERSADMPKRGSVLDTFTAHDNPLRNARRTSTTAAASSSRTATLPKRGEAQSIEMSSSLDDRNV